MGRLLLNSLSVILLVLQLVRGAPTFNVSGPSYICSRNAVAVWNMIAFFSTNFLAHAFSTPVGAETGRYTCRVPLRGKLPWTQLVCFFLPFGGLTRTILLITQHLKRGKDHVRAALAHGAILIVARTDKWTPSWEPQSAYMKLPDQFDEFPAEISSNMYADILMGAEGETHQLVKQELLQLHGEFKLPPGYSLATPADKAFTEYIIENALVDPTETSLHRVQNPLKILASVVQIGAAIYTLYRTRDLQTIRWGYASYGLSVFPYALMSLMNAVCTGIVGEYHCGHVLRTPILDEAERRGATVDGAVGRVRKRLVKLGKETQSGYTSVNVWLNRPFPSGGWPMLTVDAGHRGCKTFMANPNEHGPRVKFELSAINHDGPADSAKYQKYRSVPLVEIAFIGVLFAIATILPEVLTWILTRYKPGQSTDLQRAFMLAWLIADQLASFCTLASWIIWQRHTSIIPTAVHIIGLVILIIPALGGLVTVGQMYLEDNGFGICEGQSGMSQVLPISIL
ncbi:hypothetical protein WOLCODRAFT_106805 [Wolfiporia cocos MD-104 SS10]|uniref:Integral membrane protein n=1 Tax=Wolfiporia cocos (strain MD-104) TaxID=742152 RepID=A0A2H3IYB0_WOLCO|nr:hypothetical protein WOLCODRAFT_106805 [Wolfiporia cocos MD-104 SS10]